MAIFEEYLVTFILAHPQLAPLFRTRVYPMKIPQKERQLSLVYQMAERPRDQVIAGKTGKEKRIYILTVWSASYLEAKTKAEVVLTVFDQEQYMIGPFRVNCFEKDQRDVYDEQAQFFGTETDIEMAFINYL